LVSFFLWREVPAEEFSRDKASAVERFPSAPARSDPVRQVLILLDLFVHRMALQVRIVFLLLDALRDGLLVPKRKITRDGLPLFAGFCALQGDEFLHDGKWIEGSDKSAGPAGRNLKSAPPVFPQSFSFS
jgi:hypothetical protein